MSLKMVPFSILNWKILNFSIWLLHFVIFCFRIENPTNTRYVDHSSNHVHVSENVRTCAASSESPTWTSWACARRGHRVGSCDTRWTSCWTEQVCSPSSGLPSHPTSLFLPEKIHLSVNKIWLHQRWYEWHYSNKETRLATELPGAIALKWSKSTHCSLQITQLSIIGT